MSTTSKGSGRTLNDLSSYAIPTSTDIEFSMARFGFGQIRFWYDEDEDCVFCDNECMTRDTVKKILMMMVDNAVMTCENG